MHLGFGVDRGRPGGGILVGVSGAFYHGLAAYGTHTVGCFALEEVLAIV